MRTIALVMLLLVCAGCTTNGVYDSGKTWGLVGAIAVGAAVASQNSNSDASGSNCYWAIRGDGSSVQVCR